MSDAKAGKGNGADIGAVYELLGTVAAEVRDRGRQLDNIDHRLGAMEQDMHGMRQTLTDYHASVLGHGIMITELEGRVRRIERHLNLPPEAAE
jgi:hypothetical protein